MATLNQCSFIGNIGNDPEQGTTKKGARYAHFPLAVNQGKDDGTLWLNIMCWNTLAKYAAVRLQKGSPVFVQGQLLVQKYTDTNGLERQGIEIIAHNIQALERQPAAIENTSSEEGEHQRSDPAPEKKA